jgi:hypothetical protein
MGRWDLKSIRTKMQFRNAQNEARDGSSEVSTLGNGSADSDSSGASHFYNGLAKLFGGCSDSPPLSCASQRLENPRSLRNCDMTAPPIYSSPTGVLGPNNRIRKPLVITVGPNSAPLGRRKREDAHIARLLNEAKRQQSISSAYGNMATNPILSNDMKLTTRESRRPPRCASFNGRKTSARGVPVDIDSCLPVSAPDGDDSASAASPSSAMSFKSSGAFAGSRYSGMDHGDHSSIMTGATPRIGNLSPPTLDPEMPSQVPPGGVGDHDDDNAVPIIRRCTSTRSHIVLAILALVLSIAVITVVVSLVTTKGDGAESPQSANRPIVGTRDDDTMSPAQNGRSQSPSASPGPPSSQLGSFEPSSSSTREPTAKVTNSMMPSTSYPTPSSSESVSQMLSQSPTALQTISPSLVSMQPLPPSTLPATVFHPVGVPIQGQQGSESFGYSISLNANGTILAVGAPDFDGSAIGTKSGRVDIFRRHNSSEWIRIGQSLEGRYDQGQFGSSLALSDDGSVVAVSEFGSNLLTFKNFSVVRVFLWSEASQEWNQLGNELTSEESSSSLSVSADGKRLAVGSPLSDGAPSIFFSGQVHVFEYDDATDSWTPLGQPLFGVNTFDRFGASVALSPAGDRLAVGAPGDIISGGYVQCFDLDWQYGWNQVGSAIANAILPISSDDGFGSAISLDGDRLAVGSPWKDSEFELFASGLVAVYQLDGDWNLKGTSISGDSDNSLTGSSIQLRGDFLIVGSPGTNGGTGLVSFHRFDGNAWVTASPPLSGVSLNQDFGFNVASDRNATIIAVGSPAETIQSSPPGSVGVFSL